MPLRTLEYRTFSGASVRDVADRSGTIAVMDGRAVVYNSLSVDIYGFKEKFDTGAFTDCLKSGADLRALVNHDSAMIVGRQSAGTLRIIDAEDALNASIDIPDVSYGRDVVVSVKRGDTSGMSFCFDELEDDWLFQEDGSVIRTVHKANIYEVTITAFPAYPATSIGVRSYLQSSADLLKAAREKTARSTPQANWLDDRIKLLWRLHESAGR